MSGRENGNKGSKGFETVRYGYDEAAQRFINNLPSERNSWFSMAQTKIDFIDDEIREARTDDSGKFKKANLEKTRQVLVSFFEEELGVKFPNPDQRYRTRVIEHKQKIEKIVTEKNQKEAKEALEDEIYGRELVKIVLYDPETIEPEIVRREIVHIYSEFQRLSQHDEYNAMRYIDEMFNSIDDDESSYFKKLEILGMTDDDTGEIWDAISKLRNHAHGRD